MKPINQFINQYSLHRLCILCVSKINLSWERIIKHRKKLINGKQMVKRGEKESDEWKPAWPFILKSQVVVPLRPAEGAVVLSSDKRMKKRLKHVWFSFLRVVTDLTGINQKQLNAYWLLILIRNDEGEEREGRCGRRGSRSCRREREDLPGADR